MQINFQGKNIELTEAIKEYISKRVGSLDKMLSGAGGEVEANVEVVKTTNHHKAGEIFHASSSIKVGGQEFYGETDNEDLYGAIDEIKEILSNEIRKSKDRRQTLFKRGASSIKKMLKGLSGRNPFTSKY